jgi:hypothetical protein
MRDKEFNGEEIKSFERDLSSLRPRAKGLDPAWRSMLAKEVELNAMLRWQRPPGATEPPPVFGCGHDRCTSGGGHWFVCVYCGSDLPVASRVGRWAWPAALAVMTSIAAMLLVVLGIQQQGPTASGIGSASEHRLALSPQEGSRVVSDISDRAESNRSAPPRREPAGSTEIGVWPRLIASKQPDGREVLTAGDMQRAVTLGSLGSFLTPN